MHYSRKRQAFDCVLFQENQKSTCLIKKENMSAQLDSLLRLSTGRTIIFLDDYVKFFAAGEEARLKYMRWQSDYYYNHRFVIVYSMVVQGKEYHPEDNYEIPSHLDVNDQPCAIETASGDAEMKTKRMRCCSDWICGDLKSVLRPSRTISFSIMQCTCWRHTTKRPNLMSRKWRETKCWRSARLMCDVTTQKAIDILDEAFQTAPNIELCINKAAGDASSVNVIHRLFARYARAGCDPHVRFVSKYVAMKMACRMDPCQVLRFRNAFALDPAVEDGQLFKVWFLAELTHKGIGYTATVGSKTQEMLWKVASLHPGKHEILLVRFIQVARSEDYGFVVHSGSIL